MDFYFNRKGFDKKTKLLTYLLNTTNYLLLITGPKNTGKTTFTENWLSNKNNLEHNDLNNIFISKLSLENSNDITIEDIKEYCVTNWQLNIDENFVISFKDVINNIPKNTMYQYVLVIDNAQRLSKPVLNELIALNASSSNFLFRLVLVGDNSLLKNVSEFLKGKTYKYNNTFIKPLTFRETRLFLIELYRKHDKTVPFSFDEVKKIYQNSKGIMPNIINEVKNFSFNKTIRTVRVKKKLVSKNILKNLYSRINLDFLSEYKYAFKNISLVFLGLIILGLFIFQEEINESIVENKDNDSNHTTIEYAQIDKIKPISEEKETQKEIKIISNNTQIKDAVQNDKIKANIESISNDKSKKQTRTNSVNNRKSLNTEDSTYILKLDSENYTIQLGAYPNKQDAINFINININNKNLRKEFKIVAANRNKAVYYLVLYGNYESRALAVNYVKILKDSLKANGPWIRQIAGVKQDISALS